MKIGILGAGISGLSIGRLLNDTYDVTLIEKKSLPGGIARTKDVEGVSYHVTGGHCFNSKHKDVLDFVFGQILPKESWHLINRNSMIQLKDGLEVPYPIEYSIKKIYQHDKILASNIIKDFLSTNENTYNNLDEWFRGKFGETLAKIYFLPYNKKIWNRDPKFMDPSWVKDKLPIPDKDSFISALLEEVSDSMPHSKFYYPNTNNQNTFIDNLAGGLNIIYDTNVKLITYNNKENNWLINNSYEFDLIINTLPLNILPRLINHCPDSVVDAAGLLKYNKVSTMLWESRPTTKTWTYLPDPKSIFHRYIHIGNFFKPNSNYTITEVIGDISRDEIAEHGKLDKFLIRPVDNNVSEHAYVVYDSNYNHCKNIVMEYLNDIGLYTLGRFGEWEYYNMDICIKKSIELKEKITRNFADEGTIQLHLTNF